MGIIIIVSPFMFQSPTTSLKTSITLESISFVILTFSSLSTSIIMFLRYFFIHFLIMIESFKRYFSSFSNSMLHTGQTGVAISIHLRATLTV